ncbi:MAG: ThiF family adenylyltransferase [Clostridia bacterium]|nr:ThiF family adenylyltransferase [Clostridia bacterium]
MMLNEEQIKKLFSARIIVFGVGGVGGAVVEMLIRSGIHNLSIVDFDTISTTNINRQLVANINNVGKLKVDEFEKKIGELNPNAEVTKYPIKLDENTIKDIDFSCFDYIVDCIDDVNAKKLLIKKAKEIKIPILCAMGAGNRYAEIPQFEICDISKTSYDKLAKVIRKFCVEERINKLQVCYTKQKPLKIDCKTIGSVVYYPINMASVMSAKVINDILN